MMLSDASKVAPGVLVPDGPFVQIRLDTSQQTAGRGTPVIRWE